MRLLVTESEIDSDMLNVIDDGGKTTLLYAVVHKDFIDDLNDAKQVLEDRGHVYLHITMDEYQ